MGALDAIVDSAIEGIKAEMHSEIERAGSEYGAYLNAGQQVLLYDYAIPAMQEVIDESDGSNITPDDLIFAAFDSHEAVEQALSETVDAVAQVIADLAAVLQGLDIVDFLDFV